MKQPKFSDAVFRGFTISKGISSTVSSNVVLERHCQAGIKKTTDKQLCTALPLEIAISVFYRFRFWV